MSKAEICNTIILIIQSIILLGQLSLSRKIHNSDISKEKGYFIIEETNHKHFDKDHFRDLFEFDFETIIGFHLSGESDVIVKGSKTIINGVVTKENVIPREILFTLDKRFNKYCHKIMLNDNYLAQDKLDITIILYLENNRGYKYSESVIMQFENQHDTGEYKFWRLHKYNMVIN